MPSDAAKGQDDKHMAFWDNAKQQTCLSDCILEHQPKCSPWSLSLPLVAGGQQGDTELLSKQGPAICPLCGEKLFFVLNKHIFAPKVYAVFVDLSFILFLAFVVFILIHL